MKKLNMGCGADVRPGYINMDINKAPGVDIVHDLDKFPYPFKDNEFDEIMAYSVLEHVGDLFKTMKELHRILKPGGKLDIIVPHYTGPIAWGNPDHLRTFAYDSFKYFINGHTLEKYTNSFFSRAQIIFRFGKRFQIWNWVIEAIANKFPKLYENTPLHIFPALGLRIIMTK